MRKSFFWLILFLFVAGCRLLPTKTITPTPFQTEEPLNTPGTPEIPTAVITLTQTPTSTIFPTLTPTPSPAPTITITQLPYSLQSASPVYVKNFNHPDKGCNWLGVAGQVFAADGNPMKNLVVVIQGKLGEAIINSVVLTGLETADAYGPGGYEIPLGDKVIGSTKSLSIYLNDLNGNALSSEIDFDTYADCNKNLIIINFKSN